MNVTLDERTAQTVEIYFEQAQDPFIKSVLPQRAKTLAEALSDYRETLLPSAGSYGRIIRAEGKYIGDVWCFSIDPGAEPNAMLSYCIFDRAYWNRGIATKAVSMFMEEIPGRYGLNTLGAFTFSDNAASIRVLEKNGFLPVEAFVEDGRESAYYQYSFNH